MILACTDLIGAAGCDRQTDKQIDERTPLR